MILDFETSRFPDGSPYRHSAQAISWASEKGFHYHTDPDFVSALQAELNEAKELVGINLKYDIGWLRRIGCQLRSGIRIWDAQLAEFVLSGQTAPFESMDLLCQRYGIAGKNGGLEDFWNNGIETREIPREQVEAYNVGDISRTLQIYESQLKDPRMTPALERLIWLQGADLLVLQKMEQNGILYDASGSIIKGNEILERITKIKAELNDIVDFLHFNFDSGDHISCLLYGGTVSVDCFNPVTAIYQSGPRQGMEYTQNRFSHTETKTFPGLFKPLPRTALKKPGYYQTGEPVLRQLPTRTKEQRRVLHLLLQLSELSKQVGSFLHALPELAEKQGWEGNSTRVMLHPTYNQCVARTGRLSCSKPNAQQFDEVTDQFWKSRYE